MGEYYNIGYQECQPILEDRDRFLFLRGGSATVGQFDLEVSI